jgi:hypothetical protein
MFRCVLLGLLAISPAAKTQTGFAGIAAGLSPRPQSAVPEVPAAKPTKEEERARKQREKEAEQQAKSAAKEERSRKKEEGREYLRQLEIEAARPAIITVRARAEDAKALLVAEFTQRGYGIMADSPYQLAFGRDFSAQPGLLGTILFGRAMPNAYRYVATFVFVPAGEMLTVTARVDMWVQNGYGALERFDVTSRYDMKRDLVSILNGIKARLDPPPAIPVPTPEQKADPPRPPENKEQKKDEKPAHPLPENALNSPDSPNAAKI